ncbi:hypothetical protein CL657_00785 [bacterium]|nr:hypothetical protein [bacterium]
MKKKLENEKPINLVPLFFYHQDALHAHALKNINIFLESLPLAFLFLWKRNHPMDSLHYLLLMLIVILLDTFSYYWGH